MTRSAFDEMLRELREAEATALPAWRVRYAEELGRFAEALRPRFASGELRAPSAADLERDGGASSPFHALERLCCEHFRLAELDPVALRVMLDVSPHAGVIGGAGWTDDVYWLQAAIAWDVIALARAREMYLPAPGELRDPAEPS